MQTIKELEDKRIYGTAQDKFISAVIWAHPNVDSFRAEYNRASDKYYGEKFFLPCRRR